MDFVDWSGFLLATCIKKNQTFGLNEFYIAEILSKELSIPNFRKQPEFSKSTYYKGMVNAIEVLKGMPSRMLCRVGSGKQGGFESILQA